MPFVASTGVLNSFDVGTGNREDLLDIITNISPMDTLYLSGFEKVPKNHPPEPSEGLGSSWRS